MSITKPTILLVLLALLALGACGDKAGGDGSRAMPAGLALQSGEMPFGGFAISSGQPTEARVKEVAPHVLHVVNFRMPDEMTFDEAQAVKDAGGSYIHWPMNLDGLRNEMKRIGAYAIFQEGLKEPTRMTYFHCGSGNRVGALWALFQAEVKKKPLEDAIAAGKDAGLTTLEPLVREILGTK